MAFTTDNAQVQQLLKDQPTWTPQRATDWANRYWSESPSAPQDTSTSPSAQPITNTSGVMNTQATTGNQVQQGQPTTVAGAFQQALVNRLAPGPISAQSPEVAPAIEANKLAEQRGAERQRAQLGVQGAQEGIDASGGMRSLQQGIEANRSAREGQFAGNAVSQLAQQRANQITQALSLGGQLLSDQDRLALQRELANLDAQLRREGLSVQSSLGQSDLDLRRYLGESQLSANLGMFNASQGQQALLSLLGGL